MIDQIIAALITGAALAMMFSNTRNIGIIATSALAFLYPKPILAVVLLGIAFYIYRKVLLK